MEIAYFDYAASTPVDPRVLHEMRPFLEARYGNPSSLHLKGREGREAVELARTELAAHLGAEHPEEIVFTSGGTESNNLALKGVALARRHAGRHLVTTKIEHDSVLNTTRWLEENRFEVTYLDVDAEGLVDPAQLASSLRRDTILVSIMHANNEIGTVQPLRDLGRVCAERGVPLHTDACQSFGKLPLDVRRDALGLVSVNAHKIYGPKGVGALYLRGGLEIEPLLHGGGHERGLRSSTENVPGIVGLGKASALCRAERATETPRLVAIRDRIIGTLLREHPGAYLNGHRTRRLPTNVNVGFHGLEGEAVSLVLQLDDLGIETSGGSACSSHSEGTPSHVLVALGRDPIEARGALRISTGRFTRDVEVDRLLEGIHETIGSLRPIASVPPVPSTSGGT